MQLIMFDIDGTLTQTCKLDEICFLAALEDMFGLKGLNGDPSVCRHFTGWGVLDEVYSSAFGKPLDKETLKRFTEHFTQLVVGVLKENSDYGLALEGAVDFVETLKVNPDFKISFATGTWHELAKFKLKHAGFGVEECPLATASEAIARVDIMQKSYDKACAQYNLDAFESITFIGDGPWDAKASQEKGYRFVGIGEGERAAQLVSLGAEYVFPNYKNKDAVLNALQN